MDTHDRDERRRAIGRERRERTRQKLLAAAARTLAEYGERKTRIDDFIAAAGVARGTFYNCYSTRDDLIADLWNTVGRDPLREIFHACEGLNDAAERVSAQSRLVLNTAAADPTWGWLVYSLSTDRTSVNDDLMAFPRPDLIIGKREGRFRYRDLDSASDCLVGTVRQALRAVISEGRSPDYADAIAQLMLEALGLDEAEATSVSRAPLPVVAGQGGD